LFIYKLCFNFFVFIKGIRDGLTQASMRYAKANNENTPDYYDPSNPKS